MRVIEADAMGMCFGVRDALAAMRGVERPAQVTVLGQLVHNPVVTRELAQRGFAQVDEAGRDASAVRTPEVLITAHGVSDRERAGLEARGKRVVDTTCPLVRKAHAAAMALHKAGFFVVVAGKRGHVEVRGLTGDLERFAVVETAKEVGRWEAERIAVIAQTTAVEREVREIVGRVRTMNPQAEVRFVNTICQPTRDRQEALERLVGQVEVLVVVGGRNSNNTRELVRRAEEVGVRAVHVEGPEGLDEAMFEPWEVAGLTAGTSTLAETIATVKVRLEGFYADPCQAHAVENSEKQSVEVEPR